MAAPRTENGFTMIANELFEAIIKAKFNGTQYAIILAIIRAVDGFHKPSRTLGIAFFEKTTGRHRRHIAKELEKLVKRKIVTVVCQHTHGVSRALQLNKDYECWLTDGEGMSENTQTGMSEITHLPMSENTH